MDRGHKLRPQKLVGEPPALRQKPPIFMGEGEQDALVVFSLRHTGEGLEIIPCLASHEVVEASRSDEEVWVRSETP